MARRTNTNGSGQQDEGPRRVHVVKLRLDADEMKGLRVAAAMTDLKPSDLARQAVLAEIQRVWEVEGPKLRQPKKK